ncbi:MAG: hypothetical protein RLZZ04_3217 [Cyanobacteriota bacterium]
MILTPPLGRFICMNLFNVRIYIVHSASLGHGLHPTWYYGHHTKVFASTHWLFQLIKIPIDHIFLSEDIQVNQVMAGSSGVSDHRLLISKIRV